MREHTNPRVNSGVDGPATGVKSLGADGRARPVRVLYVEVNEDGTVGGSHQALYDLVKGLDRTRFEPVVLFYQDNEFAHRLREIGAAVHVFDQERSREMAVRRGGRRVAKVIDILFGAIARRAGFLRRHAIDLLHLNNAPHTGHDDWLPAARVSRIPCVVSAMSIAPETVGAVQRGLMRRYDAVLPVSRFILEDWAAAGIPRERMRIVHHGVDLDALRGRVTRTPAAVRKALGVPDGALLAVMVANVRRWKGQHVVLEALALLDDATRSRVYTVFAGGVDDLSHEYRAELDQLVERHDLGRHVAFLGARPDVPDLLNAADLAIHASVRPEPGGIAVLEAMALGTVVVAAEVGGHAEVMTSDCGFTFDTGDPGALAGHLARLIGDEPTRRQVGERARARMEEFRIERNVRETEAAYDMLLSPNARTRST